MSLDESFMYSKGHYYTIKADNYTSSHLISSLNRYNLSYPRLDYDKTLDM